MKNHFTDKKILVIGGSSGIGEATARAFADVGGRVTIASRNMPKLQAAATRIGLDIEVAELNTTNDESVQRFSREPVDSTTLLSALPRRLPGPCGDGA
jgi:NAD(P)-dependent dehydrogenase (short-subunit alcohol dehydrogenase family)